MQIYELEPSCRLAGEEILQGILGEGLPPGSPNPNTLKFQTKKCHFPHPFSDLAFRQKLCHLFIRLEHKQKVSSNAFRIFIFLLRSYSFGFETINTFMISHSSLEKQYPIPDHNGQNAVIPIFRPKRTKNHYTLRRSTYLSREYRPGQTINLSTGGDNLLRPCRQMKCLLFSIPQQVAIGVYILQRTKNHYTLRRSTYLSREYRPGQTINLSTGGDNLLRPCRQMRCLLFSIPQQVAKTATQRCL